MRYLYNRTEDLYHSGTKGMKWGYTKGGSNGKRTAENKTSSVTSGVSSNLEKAKENIKSKVQNKLGIKSKDSKNTKNSKKKKKDGKSVDSKLIADVIRGKYGNGKARAAALKKAGYDYNKTQNAVNEKLLGKSKAKKIYKKRGGKL